MRESRYLPGLGMARLYLAYFSGITRDIKSSKLLITGRSGRGGKSLVIFR
jgi:hypothetical protein